MQNEIRLTWHFDHPPRTVWDYLTKPDLLEQWLGKSDFKPIVGHKFRFESPYGNDSICQVLEITPYEKLVYSWQKNSAKDGKPFDSKIEWTLIPKGSGTDLQLVHDGFRALEDIGPHKSGWNYCHKQFEALLNTVTS